MSHFNSPEDVIDEVYKNLDEFLESDKNSKVYKLARSINKLESSISQSVISASDDTEGLSVVKKESK